MKLDKRHMRVSLALLVGSILYNVWIYTRPAQSTVPRPLVTQPALQEAAPAAPTTSVDPASIVAPPAIDLGTPPQWTRNPFLSAQQAASGAVAQGLVVAAPAEPVVRTILFSPQRSVALIDGHIVKVGDRIDIGLVAEINRNDVVIQTASGERKRLEMRAPTARPPAAKPPAAQPPAAQPPAMQPLANQPQAAREMPK